MLVQASGLLASSLDYRATLSGVARLTLPYLGDRCIIYLTTPEGTIAPLPVADVEKFDFWPARPFAVRAIRREQVRTGSTILVDWKGSARRRWGLTLHKSGVLLLDGAGTLIFAEEGPLSAERVVELRGRLSSLGLRLPP